MILQKKTLEKLRELINEETEYRSGPKIVDFFNDLGFNDIYGQGFPSRWVFTDAKLEKINGTPQIDECIKKLFSPINYIGRYADLDAFIEEFNQYFAFDEWEIIRNNAEIKFIKAGEIKIDNIQNEKIREGNFLNENFSEIDINKLGLESILIDTIKQRIDEIEKCIEIDAPLSAIFLCGSALEGILLGVATQNPMRFNKSKSAPKYKSDKAKVKPFYEWSLNNFIDVAYEINFLKKDVKEYSHSLRNFRNFIHPYQQAIAKFNPDKHTAIISWQVLKAAIYQLSQN